MNEHKALPIGTHIGPYKVEHVLGAGGFGVTYRAIDHDLRRLVAIKEYFPRDAAVRDTHGHVLVASTDHEPNFRWGLDCFVEEATTLARFSHPNILRVVQHFGAYGTGYLVLEYIQGHTLQQWLMDNRQPPTQDELDGFAYGILSALETVHRNDILHRDVGPKNLMLKAEDGSPVLIDFGSARQIVSSRTMALTALITPHYAPYEQYLTSGKGQGPWTDIYSAAASIYEIVTGRHPPESPGRTLNDTYQSASSRARSKYRDNFLKAIDWGLMSHPKDRPQSVRQWRSRLLEGMADRGASGLSMAQLGSRAHQTPIGRFKAAIFGRDTFG